ncbi:MAG: DUF3876 domain-containing protein [Bacteroides xylanisolvens]
MFSKFNKEQLEKLVFYTTGINTILLEVMLSSSPEPEDGEQEVELEIFVVETGNEAKTEPEPLNLDALCGDWKSVRKQPALLIFKAAPGYMIALGKKPKKDETGECYLIRNVEGNLCFNAGKGNVYLAYDGEKDTITLYPGGGYTRIDEPQK